MEVKKREKVHYANKSQLSFPQDIVPIYLAKVSTLMKEILYACEEKRHKKGREPKKVFMCKKKLNISSTFANGNHKTQRGFFSTEKDASIYIKFCKYL